MNNKIKNKNITDILCELATGDAFGISKLMLRCPMMHAILSKKREVDFSDLPPEQIVSIIQHTSLEDWLDGKDVKKLLKISERTLQTLRSNGTLAYSKIGGKLYYRRQDLQNLLADKYLVNKNESNYEYKNY